MPTFSEMTAAAWRLSVFACVMFFAAGFVLGYLCGGHQ